MPENSESSYHTESLDSAAGTITGLGYQTALSPGLSPSSPPTAPPNRRWFAPRDPQAASPSDGFPSDAFSR